MLSKEILKELGNLNFYPYLITTLYINVSPLVNLKGEYKIIWKDLKKSVLDNLNLEGEIKKSVLSDLEKIETIIDQGSFGSANTIVLMSCSAKNWEYYIPLYPLLKNKLVVDKDPYTKPLSHLIVANRPYYLVILSKGDARVFKYFLGEIHEEEEIKEEIPKKHKQGGWEASDWQRWHETHVIWHFKEVAEFLDKIINTNEKIILGSTSPKNISEFLEHLPKRLHDLIIGEISLELDSPIKDILEKTHELIKDYEEKENKDLVESLIVAYAKGKEAVIGLENVAHEVYQKRVQKILVEENYEQEGYECPSCYFRSTYLEVCPYCNIKMIKRADIVDEIIEEAIIERAELRYIGNKELAQKINKIGAFLRY
jgi:peptide chain release factor subunit 1